MKLLRAAGALSGLALLAAGLSCGPSFQAIYEGNARFEHCYALEENPQAPMRDKSDCWRDWSERYTFGQTRDRIHYATARYVALSQAPNVPTDEAMMMAAPGMTPRATTITAPAPTNAFEPPPKVLEVDAQAPTGTGVIGGPRAESELPAITGAASYVPDAATIGSPVALPGTSCADECGRHFRDCEGRCAADAGKGACAACDKTYRGCMRACFK
ncbi:MAG: hypothetical protein KF819_32605 [Labilithrix sp.]|nr:hypothetical protein [Labilithrix sp.]